MSRVEGLAEVVRWVADMEASLQFYRDQFGLELISPPQLPNKFLKVSEAGGIPEMIVLIPHPHPDSYFPTHREPEKRTLHHLAFRVSRHAHDALEPQFIEIAAAPPPAAHPVLTPAPPSYPHDPHGTALHVPTPP